MSRPIRCTERKETPVALVLDPARSTLNGVSVTSVARLRAATDACIAASDATATFPVAQVHRAPQRPRLTNQSAYR
jgi:hypothetical protein